MRVKPIKTRVFLEGGDLSAFVTQHIKKIPERAVIVVSSKIVALSEGRVNDDAGVERMEASIQKESEWALKTKYTWLTKKDGMLMASAGIDRSNANGKLILLPKNSFKSSQLLRRKLQKKFKVKHLGVVIADSHIHPLRAGVTAHALGYAGIRGVRDYRGTKDIFGRKMKISRTNVADSLATAAALTMGEGAEMQPLAVVRDAPVQFVRTVDTAELFVSPRDDMYWPLLKSLKKAK